LAGAWIAGIHIGFTPEALEFLSPADSSFSIWPQFARSAYGVMMFPVFPTGDQSPVAFEPQFMKNETHEMTSALSILSGELQFHVPHKVTSRFKFHRCI
jgi:hypothetical protein